MFTLDLNGKIQTVSVPTWYDGLKQHYGHYGMWTMVNVNPMTEMGVISESCLYQGHGSDLEWVIKWS